MKETKYEYWLAENTGWSGGLSWFNSSWNAARFRTRKDAEEFNLGRIAEFSDPSTKWRVTHVITHITPYSQEVL